MGKDGSGIDDKKCLSIHVYIFVFYQSKQVIVFPVGEGIIIV